MIDEKVKRMGTPCHASSAGIAWARLVTRHLLAFTRLQGNTVLIKGTHHIFVNDDGVGRRMVFDVVV